MMSVSDTIISLKNLHTHFPIRSGILNRVSGHVKAVNGIDLNIYRGEVLGLVGESGCGKTTLGKTMLQLVRPTKGEIRYHAPTDTSAEPSSGVDLSVLSNEELGPYRQKLQIVFQDPHSSLNPAFTIFGSLEDPLKQCGIKHRSDRRKIIGDLLESVNLRREYMDRYPNEFSGGQRQRIGIARALSVEPELIVCDEAVSALDVSIQAQVLQLLLDLKAQRTLTYLFITHDLSVAEYVCDRIAVMYLGEIVELGTADSLFANTLHPYTQALLSAIPTVDLDSRKTRIVLQGDVPSPVDPPSGCSFHPRCSRASAKCQSTIPPLLSYKVDGVEHAVACHHVELPANATPISGSNA